MGVTWLITGSSRGLGRALVEAALDAGDQVVATARHPEQLAEFAERYGDRLSPVALDVTDPNAVAAAVTAGVETFGGLDVVVNNAGYANGAPIETGALRGLRETRSGSYAVRLAHLPAVG